MLTSTLSACTKCLWKAPVQIGLEFLVDHRGNNASNWSVIQIFYNGQVFANTTELNTAFMDTTSGLNRQQVNFFYKLQA